MLPTIGATNISLHDKIWLETPGADTINTVVTVETQSDGELPIQKENAMRNLLMVAAASVMLGTGPVWAGEAVEAIDLTRIERTISRQPEYATDAPGYCLLVFGKQAATRVWLVQDGNTLYVDRNGNGDLTESGERVDGESTRSVVRFDAITISNPAGGDYSLRVFPRSDGTTRLRMQEGTERPQYAGWNKATKPRFARKPQDAPIIHFDGPMTLGQYGPRQTLPRISSGTSYRNTSMKLMVGTPGLGEGTFASYHCRCRREKNLTAKIVYRASDGESITTETVYKMHG
jgi:hypothetical protein